jgi:hypothetical protein
MSIVPTNINNYLRQFAHQLEERILQQFPPLHQPGEPFPAELARLRRTPYHAQALAIAGISKRWEVENSAGAICHFKQIMAESATLMVYFTAAKLWFNLDGRKLDTVNGWY